MHSELKSIQGTVPVPTNMPKGCRFHPRCPHAMDICAQKEPEMTTLDEGQVRCWLYDNNKEAAV